MLRRFTFHMIQHNEGRQQPAFNYTHHESSAKTIFYSVFAYTIKMYQTITMTVSWLHCTHPRQTKRILYFPSQHFFSPSSGCKIPLISKKIHGWKAVCLPKQEEKTQPLILIISQRSVHLREKKNWNIGRWKSLDRLLYGLNVAQFICKYAVFYKICRLHEGRWN